MIKILLIVISLAPIASASQSIIKGQAEGETSGDVSLFRYKDLITFQEEKLATVSLNKKGEFQFQTDDESTFTGIIRIGNVDGFLYIEPGTDYDIIFPAVGPKDTAIIGDMNVVDITIQNTSHDDLNVMISKFNHVYDTFMEENYRFFITKRVRGKVDTFRIEQEGLLAKVNNQYYKDYVRNSIALMDLTAHGKKYVYHNYLKDKAILYNNEAWMDLFNQFYDGGFRVLSLWNTGKDIQDLVNIQRDFPGLMNLLKNEDFLDQDQLRELFLIKGLFENYNNSEFKKSSIVSVLKQIANETSYERNKAIAQTMVKRFSRLHVGGAAPAFTMSDHSGKQVKLSDFKGKYVYLDFWATWCTPCLKEMKLMPELVKKYGDHVQYLSISIDSDAERMLKLLKRKGYIDEDHNGNWSFLYFDNQESIKENYHVKGIPLYYLIDPQGNIVQSPAYRPSGKIELTFARIAEKNKPKITIGRK